MDPARAAEFEAVALVHLDALYKTAHRLTGSREAAEEVVQETYLRAFRFFHQFERGTNCRAWLYKILRNTFASRYAKAKRDPATVDLDEVAPFLGEDDEALLEMPTATYQELLDRVLEDDVRAALMDLPEAYRMVVILADMESLPYREIADIVGVPIGTVMSRLFRGRRALRGQLVEAARRHGIGRSAQSGGTGR
ncbi:MAG: sigma-70 family RNA polymerase sigma factor [Nitrospirae bacterium]|nr:sigma-70 family RNA polymerase sigma factor [Nitrospirota bacterium]